MTWLLLIVAILAVYRLAYMLTAEEGPFGIFARLQEATARQRNWIERGLNCVLCISFWLSLIPAVIWGSSPVETIVYWFGIAGAVLLIHKKAGR